MIEISNLLFQGFNTMQCYQVDQYLSQYVDFLHHILFKYPSAHPRGTIWAMFNVQVSPHPPHAHTHPECIICMKIVQYISFLFITWVDMATSSISICIWDRNLLRTFKYYIVIFKTLSYWHLCRNMSYLWLFWCMWIMHFLTPFEVFCSCHTTGNFHDWLSNLAAYHTSGIMRGSWWHVQEFRPSELPRDSHQKHMESGGGHPLAHRDRPLPLSPTLSHRISMPNRCQWWGTSCRSCGGSSEIGVKWL